MPDISGRVKKEGEAARARTCALFYFSVRLDRLARQKGPRSLGNSPNDSKGLGCFNVCIAPSHAEMPQFVKKHPTPVVAHRHKFPYQRQSNKLARRMRDRRSCSIPLPLNATLDTLCRGVEEVGQLENTEKDGACTSLNASFLLWLLTLSNSLEGCQHSCKKQKLSRVKRLTPDAAQRCNTRFSCNKRSAPFPRGW
jgi:hypothetical protein